MRERPTLFSDADVRAILDGRKTQMRRPVKLPDTSVRDATIGKSCFTPDDHVSMRGHTSSGQFGEWFIRCPYSQPGTRLWVREAWQHAPAKYCRCPQGSEPEPCDDWSNGTGCRSYRGAVVYRADGGRHCAGWRPPIHMPRWASRITLEVTEVRVERVQDISEADAIAEGATSKPDCYGYGRAAPGWSMDWSRIGECGFGGGVLRAEDICLGSARYAFANQWNSINAKRGYSWESNPYVWVVSFRRAT